MFPEFSVAFAIHFLKQNILFLSVYAASPFPLDPPLDTVQLLSMAWGHIFT